MAEPSLVAVIGVGGILTGAFASGGVQSFLARADRRRSARSAARLLFMELHSAQAAIEDLQSLRDWDQMITDWRAYGAMWGKYSESVAAILSTSEFHAVSGAFVSIWALARGREFDERHPSAPNEPASFSVPPEHLADSCAKVEAAKTIVFAKSFTRWERFRGRDYSA